MANKILISYLDYIAYFEKLAQEHVDIGHGKNGQNAFSEFTPSLLAEISRGNKLAVKRVAWGAPEIVDGSTSPDNTHDNWMADILILDRAEGNEDEYKKISECLAIAQEFRARIKQDAKIDVDNWIKGLDISSIRFHQVRLGTHKMVGARMEFKIRVASNHFPNTDKWLSL